MKESEKIIKKLYEQIGDLKDEVKRLQDEYEPYDQCHNSEDDLDKMIDADEIWEDDLNGDLNEEEEILKDVVEKVPGGYKIAIRTKEEAEAWNLAQKRNPNLIHRLIEKAIKR